MPVIDYLTDFLGIQGFSVVKVEKMIKKERSVIVVSLVHNRSSFLCSGCHQKVTTVYDSHWLEVQHLTFWQHLTFLRFRRYRVNCPRCGIRTEELSFVKVRGPRVTTHLAHLVSELCKVMTNKAVATFQFLHRHTVKDIDKVAMKKVQENRPLEGITVLGADEISVGKGQTYWTMISSLEGPRGPEMLAIVEGRKERSLLRFWKWFGKERARGITYAVMDMWKPYYNSFKAHCPSVQIVYDKFHVIQWLLNALNDVRKIELRKASFRFKGLLTGKKFILLSRHDHIRGKARVALNLLLSANRRLLKAYLLKESFDHLWSYSSRTWARKFFAGWKEQLKWSRLPPYKKFVQMVEDHLDGILSYCDKKISLGFIEATNLKARNVIRQAYGYRDKEYMKLKVIQVCTPWMRRFQPWELYYP